MTRKRRRLWVVVASGMALSAAAALSLSAFSNNLVFFLTPSEIAAKHLPDGRSFRLGGLVEAGSVHRLTVGREPVAAFTITDGKASVPVAYAGILPDLFREGQGIVALGAMRADGTFQAAEVLAKHDETYMPKEVADALKRDGLWNPKDGPPPPASTWNTLNIKAAPAGG